jgi:hypothetical protein
MPKGRKLRSPKLDTEGNYLQQPIRHLGMLKELGRSCSDDFNETLIGQAFYSVWQGGCDTKEMQLKNGTDAEFVASHGGVDKIGIPALRDRRFPKSAGRDSETVEPALWQPGLKNGTSMPSPLSGPERAELHLGRAMAPRAETLGRPARSPRTSPLRTGRAIRFLNRSPSRRSLTWIVAKHTEMPRCRRSSSRISANVMSGFSAISARSRSSCGADGAHRTAPVPRSQWLETAPST